MKAEEFLAAVSRDFFRDHKVYKYRMHHIKDLADHDVIQFCHWYCEECRLTQEFEEYRKRAEAQYRYCPYLKEYIGDEQCSDICMIAQGYIKNLTLTEYSVESESAKAFCNECRYQLK